MTTYVYPQQNVLTVAGLGLSTEAKQDAQISELSGINTKTPALGQAAMAASTPVVVASNQSSIPIKLRDASDAAINLGQATAAASIPVVLASNQPILTVTSALNVVDQIDTTPLLNTSLTNIPSSASNSLSIVASLAADVKRVVTVEDIGEFFGLYSGPVATPTLLCVLPLGGGEVDVSITAGALVSIRNMKAATVTSGFIAINFMG